MLLNARHTLLFYKRVRDLTRLTSGGTRVRFLREKLRPITDVPSLSHTKMSANLVHTRGVLAQSSSGGLRNSSAFTNRHTSAIGLPLSFSGGAGDDETLAETALATVIKARAAMTRRATLKNAEDILAFVVFVIFYLFSFNQIKGNSAFFLIC